MDQLIVSHKTELIASDLVAGISRRIDTYTLTFLVYFVYFTACPVYTVRADLQTWLREWLNMIERLVLFVDKDRCCFLSAVDEK